MIVKKIKKEEILDLIADFLWDENVIKSLGEAIIYKENCEFVFYLDNDKVVGFYGIYPKGDSLFLNYCYVIPKERNKGIFNELMKYFESEVTNKKVKLIATKTSKPIFEKLGFVISKSFVNYFKMEKQY